MNISILDYFNHDTGLKILFNEADYYIVENKNKNEPYQYFKSFDDMKKYDHLFIITPTFDAINFYNNKSHDVSPGFVDFLSNLLTFIKTNKFKSICFFDNYDYDYDPNIIFNIGNNNKSDFENENIIFFKRNYSKNINYPNNVFSFPYTMFFQKSIIETIYNPLYLHNNIEKENRIFFCGSLFNHKDDLYGQYRNRIETMNKIKSKLNIFQPYYLQNDIFLNEMMKSKYCLDLLGCGDPNFRTFEILTSGSLRIAERSPLKWNFQDDFCEETYFDNENDLYEKIKKLENIPGLYDSCLNKQKEIVNKYMNKEYLKNEIISKI